MITSYADRGDRDVYIGDAVQRPMERAVLGAAVGATIPVKQLRRSGRRGRVTSEGHSRREGHGEGPKLVPWLQQCHLVYALLLSAAFTSLTAPGRPKVFPADMAPGRRAVINRASRCWPPSNSPAGRRPRPYVYASALSAWTSASAAWRAAMRTLLPQPRGNRQRAGIPQ